MSTFPWTAEQADILASTARITLVQAGPGSGKTKVFAELVDRRLKAWPLKAGGLAALSFTNVARDEIEGRICSVTVAPHFVGTLDAFFLRFVIGPFGHLAGLPRSGARLIPSPLDQQIAEPSVQLGDALYVSLFQITPTGGSETTPEFQFRMPHGLPARAVPKPLGGRVLAAKEKEWTTKGRVTHGDCSYLASRILNGAHGPDIRVLLARRFPVICIDEFQDTGHFLGRAALSLLAEPTIEAVVVGDVDQKIFGFSGANPDLFRAVGRLPGATQFPLRVSQRCAARVCSVASQLSRSGARVQPSTNAIEGQAMVARHTDKAAAVDPRILERCIAAARQADCRDLAVLVRKRDTKAKLLRTASKSTPPMSCRGVTQIAHAIDDLRDGGGPRAVDIAEAFVCHVLFGDARATEEEVRAAGLEPIMLRRNVRRMMLQLIETKPEETWGEWAVRAKNLCEGIAAACGVADFRKRLGGVFKAGKTDRPDEIRSDNMPFDLVESSDVRVEVLTVHEAKGREFDAVLFYCPAPRRVDGASNCPSEAWWAPAAKSEEREVAFVATTRAKRLLVLGVHEETWGALSVSRREFLGPFEPLPEATPASAAVQAP